MLTDLRFFLISFICIIYCCTLLVDSIEDQQTSLEILKEVQHSKLTASKLSAIDVLIKNYETGEYTLPAATSSGDTANTSIENQDQLLSQPPAPLVSRPLSTETTGQNSSWAVPTTMAPPDQQATGSLFSSSQQSQQSERQGGANPSTSYRVKCVEQIHPATDEVLRVYPSGTAAASFMGVGESGISQCCNGMIYTWKGFKWRFYRGPPIDCKYLLYTQDLIIGNASMNISSLSL